MKSHWTILACFATLCALWLSTVVVCAFQVSSKVLGNQVFMAQESDTKETVTDLRVKLFENKIRLKDTQKELREQKVRHN